MKSILLALLFFVVGNNALCQSQINDWVNEVKERVVNGEDLSVFSLEQIPSDVMVDLVMVIDIEIVDLSLETNTFTFRMIGPNKKETGCLEFKYFMIEDEFYLEFSKVKIINVLGENKKFTTPWISKSKKCLD